jgi:hypothetical protein
MTVLLRIGRTFTLTGALTLSAVAAPKKIVRP